MIVHLPSSWVLLLDVVAWFGLSLGVSYLYYRIDAHHFDHDDWLTKERRFEQHATFYKRFLFVMKWKELLPDGSGILRRGFAKKRLQHKDEAYLEQFIRESRRAEWTHVVAVCCIPLFLIWNTWLDECIILAYGLIANVPCILVQRFNRVRLRRIVHRRTNIKVD